MKVVCICDAGVPEMLMQYMKKLPGCDVTLYTEKTLTDIKSLTTCERTAELRGAEACPVSAEMLEAVREAEILVTHVAPVNRAVLDAAPNVKIVGVLRTGTENVNLDLCRERGIAVYNAEGRNSTAVADLVVALMLCEMRNIARAHGALVQGKWVKMFPNIMMNRDMCRCTVGIIGVGKIGTMVAARLKGFGCRILGCDIFLSPEEIEKRGCEPVSKEELLRQSDFVTIHMRHEAGQSALIGADELAMMKKNAILVNCARAGLVDTAALVEALRAHRIGGALAGLSPAHARQHHAHAAHCRHDRRRLCQFRGDHAPPALTHSRRQGRAQPRRLTAAHMKTAEGKILRRFCICGFQLFMIRSVAARAWATMSSGDSPTW